MAHTSEAQYREWLEELTGMSYLAQIVETDPPFEMLSVRQEDGTEVFRALTRHITTQKKLAQQLPKHLLAENRITYSKRISLLLQFLQNPDALALCEHTFPEVRDTQNEIRETHALPEHTSPKALLSSRMNEEFRQLYLLMFTLDDATIARMLTMHRKKTRH